MPNPSLFFTESKGSGVPLILIHGAGGVHLHWPPQLRRWAGGRVVALDLPGHGQSGGPQCGSIAEFAQATVKLLDELQISRAVVAGHSMGSGIAQTLALDYPDRVAGLVLVGAGARLRVAPQIMDGIQKDFPGTVSLIIQWAFGPNAPEPLTRLARERMLQTPPQVLLADYAACNAFDVMERVANIAAPALVLAGTADKMTPEKYGRYLAEHIPGAQLRLFEGAGHMVMLEQPDEVTAAITAFVATL